MTATATKTASKTATKTASKTASKTAAKKVAATKTAAVTTTKVRRPAKELMAERKRMFFGAPYMNAVLGEFCRDQEKMVQHAAHLKLGTPSSLRQLKLETLRSKLAEAIMNTENGAEAFSIKL